MGLGRRETRLGRKHEARQFAALASHAQQVASRCKDPWTVGFAGSGPVGAAKGAMLLSVGKSAPLYSYVVAAVQ